MELNPIEITCLNCTANCCKLVIEVNRSEYNKFVALGMQDSFVTNTDKFIAKSPKYTMRRDALDEMYEDNFAEMKKGKDGLCIHWNEKKLCSIYEDRPQVCRDYQLNRCEGIRCIK